MTPHDAGEHTPARAVYRIPKAKRVGVVDHLEIGSQGMRARKGRTALSALGVAVGIAALVAVLGLAQSSKADLMATLDRLGTNLLTVGPGNSMFAEEARLPTTAPGMIAGLASVEKSAEIRKVSTASVRRSDLIPNNRNLGLWTGGASLNLLDTLEAELSEGRWLDAATERLPTVVLGHTAARRLGIVSLERPVAVWIGDRWFTVIGILSPVTLAPDLDEAALIGVPVSNDLVAEPVPPSAIYVRAVTSRINSVRSILARTANPESPTEVDVSRPSDALEAQSAADESFTTLSVGLGAVALLVGGIGIANVMVIGVLERRREIGVRRSLGATRGQIRLQFLIESILLAALGGVVGAVLGMALTTGFAMSQGLPAQIPFEAMALGLVGAMAVGLVAGSYPAARAAQIPPTEALRY